MPRLVRWKVTLEGDPLAWPVATIEEGQESELDDITAALAVSQELAEYADAPEPKPKRRAKREVN